MPSMSKEYRDKWYAENHESHLAFCNRKVVCECGRSMNYTTLAKHMTLDIHKKLMDKIKKDKEEIRNSVIKEILNIKESVKDTKNKKIDPELSETSEINIEQIEQIENDNKDEQTEQEQCIINKCKKCGFESENKKKFGNHFVSNRHKYSEYIFD